MPDYLLATGTDNDSLVNPVYYRQGQTIVVWVAAIQENRLTVNPDGTLATGSILSKDAFDTRYIRCRSLPMLPEESWVEMLTKGVYKEWDQLLATPVRETQAPQDPSNLLALQPLCQIGGFAKKVNFTFFSPQTAPQADRLRHGT